MNIDDCSAANFGERVQNFIDQLVKKDDSVQMKIQSLDIAERRANEEMLDEIHCMLRYIIKKLDGTIIK